MTPSTAPGWSASRRTARSSVSRLRCARARRARGSRGAHGRPRGDRDARGHVHRPLRSKARTAARQAREPAEPRGRSLRCVSLLVDAVDTAVVAERAGEAAGHGASCSATTTHGSRRAHAARRGAVAEPAEPPAPRVLYQPSRRRARRWEHRGITASPTRPRAAPEMGGRRRNAGARHARGLRTVQAPSEPGAKGRTCGREPAVPPVSSRGAASRCDRRAQRAGGASGPGPSLTSDRAERVAAQVAKPGRYPSRGCTSSPGARSRAYGRACPRRRTAGAPVRVRRRGCGR